MITTEAVLLFISWSLLVYHVGHTLGFTKGSSEGYFSGLNSRITLIKKEEE